MRSAPPLPGIVVTSSSQKQNTGEAYEAERESPSRTGRYKPGSDPSPVRGLPGELSPWSGVAQFVGLLLPEHFNPPGPGPDETPGAYPSLTRHKTAIGSGVRLDEDTYVLNRTKDVRWFLHARICESLHGLHPTAERARGLSRSPAAFASGVGETGTVVYIGDDRVITAWHVWAKLEDRSRAGERVFVVFDFQDPELAIAPQQTPPGAEALPFGGWGRYVRNVYEVTRVEERGPADTTSYPPQEDWVVLKVDLLTGEDLAKKKLPFEFKAMGAIDWVNGRARCNDPLGDSPRFVHKDRFEFGDLVMIGHPLGVPKRLAEGGDVLEQNGRIFRHDLDSFSGNSGAPIFRPALGTVEMLWLVGINLGGLDMVQDGDYLVPSSCRHGEARAPNENLAVDIRAIVAAIEPSDCERCDPCKHEPSQNAQADRPAVATIKNAAIAANVVTFVSRVEVKVDVDDKDLAKITAKTLKLRQVGTMTEGSIVNFEMSVVQVGEFEQRDVSLSGEPFVKTRNGGENVWRGKLPPGAKLPAEASIKVVRIKKDKEKEELPVSAPISVAVVRVVVDLQAVGSKLTMTLRPPQFDLGLVRGIVDIELEFRGDDAAITLFLDSARKQIKIKVDGSMADLERLSARAYRVRAIANWNGNPRVLNLVVTVGDPPATATLKITLP